MNCPGCGTQTYSDQQFCRSCGADLADGTRPCFNPRAWLLITMMLAFGGLLITMSGKLFDLRWLTFVGVFILIGGMFFMAGLAMWRQTRPRKHKPAQPPQPATIERGDTTNKLLPVGANDDYIPSVTEPTTELLKTPVPIRSDPRDGTRQPAAGPANDL